MANTLFRRDIEPCCAYCAHGSPMNEETILCDKKGPMQPTESCRRFRYDPLLRIPPKPAVLRGKFTAEDFKLEEVEDE